MINQTVSQVSVAASVPYVSAHIATWVGRGRRGVVWVEYDSEVLRDAAIDEIDSRVPRQGLRIVVKRVEIREDWERLEAELERATGLVHLVFSSAIQDFEAISPAFAVALNLSREKVFALPISQIWWVQSKLARELQARVPDFLSWVTLRFSLTDKSLQQSQVPSERRFAIPTAEASRPSIENPADLRGIAGMGSAVELMARSLELERDGRYKDSVAAAARAVYLVRQESANSGDRWILPFALRNLSIRLARVGNHSEASVYAKEATDIELESTSYFAAPVNDGRFEDDRWGAIRYDQLGAIAEEQRDFAAAREWYLKALAISEKQGNEHSAAVIYHQLGMIAQEQRDFATAREWYLKSLAMKEEQGNEHGAASTYHQLGMIAQQQRDFTAAREWYLKSLAISEKLGIEHFAAINYHQLGRIAEEQRDFAAAREWYLKSLAIKERQGNEHGSAISYHQLGNVAVEQHDFATARDWWFKSLAISEKQGNEHGAASTYGSLGIAAGLNGEMEQCAAWLVKAIRIFVRFSDEHEAQRNARNFASFYQQASPADRAKMKAIWQQSGLGDLPT